MTVPAEKSFEIQSARQFLDEVLHPNFADFFQDRLSSRKAINCALSAWHLWGWVWNQHAAEVQTTLGLKSDSEFVSRLFAECPELRLIREIANGSKHVMGKGSAVAVTEISHGHPIGPMLLFTQSHLVVKPSEQHLTVRGGERLHFAEHLFKKVVDYWDGLFTRLGL